LKIGIRVWKLDKGWKLELGLEIGSFYSQVVVCQEVVVNAFKASFLAVCMWMEQVCVCVAVIK
jgi:hypothetical protein